MEQAFELSDASAERSAAGCTIKLNKEPISEYLQSNITMLRWMIDQGISAPSLSFFPLPCPDLWCCSYELICLAGQKLGVPDLCLSVTNLER